MKSFFKLLFFGVSDAPCMVLRKPDNDDTVKVQFGFSLSLLFLSTFFGLPLLSRRLWGWAAAMFALSTVQIWKTVNRFSLMLSAIDLNQIETAMQTDFWDNAVEWSLLTGSVLLAFKGNEWTVKNLLKKGWRFTDPDNALVQKAAAKWKLSKHFLKKTDTL